MSKYKLTESDVETIISMAQNDMDLAKAARKGYISSNGMWYRVRRLAERTGLDARCFFDLVTLVRSVAPELLQSEEELGEPEKVVLSRLPRTELLNQLAEEAAELAQAALKLRRTLSPINPTPVSQERALAGLVEELADVQNAAALVRNAFRVNQAKVDVVAGMKMARWAGRLTEETNREG